VVVVEALAALRSMPPPNLQDSSDLAALDSIHAKLEERAYLEAECRRLEAEEACMLLRECKVSCQGPAVAPAANDAIRMADTLDETEIEIDLTCDGCLQEEVELHQAMSVRAVQAEVHHDASLKATQPIVDPQFDRPMTRARDNELGDRLHDVATYMRGRIDEIRAARRSAVTSSKAASGSFSCRNDIWGVAT